MATRNSVGRRMLSEAELEFANPFDEGTISNFEESFNSVPVVDNSTKQNLVNQLLDNWQGLGPEYETLITEGGEVQQATNRYYNGIEQIFDTLALQQGFDPYVGVGEYNEGFSGQYQRSPEAQNYVDDLKAQGYTTAVKPTGSDKYDLALLDPTGKEVMRQSFDDSGVDFLKQAAAFAAIALTAGGAGGLLGSTLTGGALSGTAASALGNALISGTAGALTGQDPLKAALLAAGGTYAGGLFGGADAATKATDAQNIAEYAQELAAQGLPTAEVKSILEANGVTPTAANSAALSATDGTSLNQIVSDLTNYTKGGLFTNAVSQAPVTPTEVVTSPEGLQTVTATGTAAAPVATLSDIVAAIPAAVLPQAATPTVDLPALEPTGLMASEAPQAVEVTGTAATPEAPTLQDIIVALTASLPPEAPQAVEVTGALQQTEPDNVLAAVAPAVVPSAPVNETIEVTGTKSGVTSEDTGATIGAIPGVLEPGVGPQSGGGLETADQAARTEKQDTGLTLKDLYTALQALGALSSSGLFGGGGGGGTQRPFVAPTATVPVGNDDYYRAVQQYYNTYMPAAPRDVATPLQQWYQGKFGG